MKRLILLLLSFSSIISFSQVGINTTTPDASSMLDITATNKGILVPRVSLNNVASSTIDGTNTAATGLLIWNTNATTIGGNGVGFYFFNGAQWIPIVQSINHNTLDQAYDQGGAGAGRTITADAGAVLIQGTDGIQSTGTFGSGTNLALSGAGTRMFFYPKKSALRVGTVVGTEWNDSNIGNYSTVIGNESSASGENSLTLGYKNSSTSELNFILGSNNSSTGINCLNIGHLNNSSGDGNFTLGVDNRNTGIGNISVGLQNTHLGNYSYLFGYRNNSIANNSIGLGNNNLIRSNNSALIGENNTSDNEYCFALGISNTLNGSNLYALGNNNIITSNNDSFAIGNNNNNSGLYNYSLGLQNSILGDSSFAIGYRNINQNENTFSFGNENRINNNNAIAIGHLNNLTGEYSMALGTDNISSGENSFIIGSRNRINSAFSLAFGNSNNNLAYGSFTFGNSNVCSNTNAISMGNLSISRGINSLTIGNGLESFSYFETCLGSYNTDYTPVDPSNFNGKDRLLVIGNGPDSFTKSDALVMLKSGDTRLNGYFGIQRDATTNALEVEGNASKTVAGSWLANSDGRLKKDIKTISPTDALYKILKLRGVNYFWNDDKTGMKRPKEIQTGFIAQEIQEVFPEKVSTDKQGYLQTAYGDYDPIIFQAIKALNEKIEKLEKENQELRKLIQGK